MMFFTNKKNNLCTTYQEMVYCTDLNLPIRLKTRGTFGQVPTRRIRLSFVECAYSDLCDIFFS